MSFHTSLGDVDLVFVASPSNRFRTNAVISCIAEPYGQIETYKVSPVSGILF